MAGFPNKTPEVLAWMAKTDNGKIPLSQLAIIQPEMYDADLGGPCRMWPEAAAAMSAMIEASRQDGCFFTVKYSYRTYAKQVEKWINYLNGGTLAARPGTSNHGDAITGDLTNLDQIDIIWLDRNGPKFGYYADVPGEIWHRTYYGRFDADKWQGGEDMNLDLYVEGEEKYRERYKRLQEEGKADPDPGPPPEDREKFFKKGWSSARAGMNNPK